MKTSDGICVQSLDFPVIIVGVRGVHLEDWQVG